EKAWRLQWDRLEGKHLPSTIDDGRFLEYGYIAQLGQQMQQLLNRIDRKSLHCIFYDDFKENPGNSYRQLLTFLGLPDDGREDFSTRNASVQVRSPKLNVAVKRLAGVRDRLGLPKGMGISKAFKRLNTGPGRTQLRPEFRRELQ